MHDNGLRGGDVIGVILAGGRGERLAPLTRDRTKGAVPFGGMFRLIDFTLSNALHSGLRQIYLLPQYKYASLKRHLNLGWSLFRPELEESLTVVPPQEGIVDYPAVVQAMASDLEQRGGRIVTNAHVADLIQRDQWVATTSAGDFTGDLLINCAGLHCDRVSQLAGHKRSVRIVPLRQKT